MADVIYEGTIEYFRLSDDAHIGPYSNSKKIPIVSVGIKNEQEGLKEFRLPVDMPKDPFSIRLVEREMKGQKVTYESRYEDQREVRRLSGRIWRFQVHSGMFEGVDYTLEELVDF